MTRILVSCESCGQRVGVVYDAPGKRRRVVRHKTNEPAGRFRRVEWCPGQFERQEQSAAVLLIGHPFQRLDGWSRCIHVTVANGVGRPCDRPEHEHAPVSTSSETGA